MTWFLNLEDAFADWYPIPDRGVAEPTSTCRCSSPTWADSARRASRSGRALAVHRELRSRRISRSKPTPGMYCHHLTTSDVWLRIRLPRNRVGQRDSSYKPDQSPTPPKGRTRTVGLENQNTKMTLTGTRTREASYNHHHHTRNRSSSCASTAHRITWTRR